MKKQKKRPPTPREIVRVRLLTKAMTIRAGLDVWLAGHDAKLGAKKSPGVVTDGNAIRELRGRLPVWFRSANHRRLELRMVPLMLEQPIRTPKDLERPTPEMAQHCEIDWDVIDRDSVGNPTAVRARNADPLAIDWYWRKGSIDSQMRDAGAKFAQLYFEAGKVPRTNVMWRERVQSSLRPSNFGADIDDYTEAQKGLEEAMRVLSPLEIDVMRDVAGLNKRASGPGRVRLLQLGLRALAVHWNIAFNATTGRRKPIKVSRPENSA